PRRGRRELGTAPNGLARTVTRQKSLWRPYAQAVPSTGASILTEPSNHERPRSVIHACRPPRHAVFELTLSRARYRMARSEAVNLVSTSSPQVRFLPPARTHSEQHQFWHADGGQPSVVDDALDRDDRR